MPDMPSFGHMMMPSFDFPRMDMPKMGGGFDNSVEGSIRASMADMDNSFARMRKSIDQNMANMDKLPRAGDANVRSFRSMSESNMGADGKMHSHS